MANWHELIVWSRPHSISELTSERGARTIIPKDRGFYAFVEGARTPSPGNCLYIGIAVQKNGLYGRLGSYLRKTVTADKAETMKHRGKRLLSFARIKGVDGAGSASQNTEKNDSFIHVSWALAPLEFGATAKNDKEYAFMLERALVDFYRPPYNTADWDPDLALELDDEAF